MRIDKEKYVSHIRNNDNLIEMRKVLDKAEIVINNHLIDATDFLDPYSRFLAKSILNRFDEIDYIEEGGIKEAERQIITIYPDYYNLDNEDFGIIALRIKGDLESLSHKDFLGAVLNLGINRSKIGDILIHDKHVDLIVKKEIADFIIFNLEKIGNKKVSISEISTEDLIPADIIYNEIRTTLPSYRLDSYISGAYNLSRQESMNLIKNGNVRVNWEPIDKASKELKEGDIISTRGYGRSILHSVEGISKKGRIKSTIRILI